MKNTEQRENLGRYYKHRFDYFKKQMPEFDPLTIETHLNVIRTADLLRHAVDSSMRKHDLTGPALGVLLLLETSPGRRLTMNEIGEQQVVSQANVTGLVDTLESRKMVQRKNDPADRRIRYIEITALGSKKLREIHPAHIRFVQSVYKPLNSKEKKSLVEALQTVRQALLKTLGILLLSLCISASSLFAQENKISQAAAEAQKVWTLSDCFNAASDSNEDLQIRQEALIQLKEEYRQAFGAILPNISFNAMEFLQDTTGVDAGGGVGNTLASHERPQAQFTAHQPIFAGFREFYAASAVKSETRSQELLYRRARTNLFNAVAVAFYTVLQNETDLKNIQNTIRLTQDRVKELRDRSDLGKSRESEILRAESQLATARFQEEQAKGAIEGSRETLSLLIGKDLSQVPLQDSLQDVRAIESMEQATGRAALRSEVLAAQQNVETSRKKYKVARGSLLPTADATANYYTKRTGFQEPIDWDITLNLRVPIFEGGETLAQMRQYASIVRASEIALRQTLRSVTSEIKRNYLALRSSIVQAQSLSDALKKAESSYQAQVREYRYGLVNNLDVLESLNALQDARRAYDRTLIQAKLDLLQLKVATEEMP